MGNLKIRWGTGAVLGTIVAGLLVLVVIIYFRAYAHAEVNQASNLQKSEPDNHTVEKEHSSKLVQKDKDMMVEMEWMRRQQIEAKKNASQNEAKPTKENSNPATAPTHQQRKSQNLIRNQQKKTQILKQHQQTGK